MEYIFEKLRKKNYKNKQYKKLMEKNLSTFDKTEICESQIDHVEAFLSFQKTSLRQNTTEENKEKEGKNSMENFCYRFFNDFSEKTHQIITIKELTQRYKIKNRRVYELMGILEGFSFVHKMKKVGHYMWMGVRSKQCHFQFEQNRSVALKNVAGLLKLLLNKFGKGLSICQLNEKMTRQIEDKTKLKQCKLTINRRIYQCLKVMKIMGMVQKQNCNFKLVQCGNYKPKLQAESLPVSITQNKKI